MAAFVHPTQFRHFLQKYKQDTTVFDEIDIEEKFNCRYVSLNAAPGKVKNVYTESFAEKSMNRVYTPMPDKIAYDSSDVTLTLRWRQGSEGCENVQEDSNRFFEYVSAQKLEYHDTFRPNAFWQLILTNAPTIKGERLYGDQQYRVVEYKFTNFGGKAYSESQIK